MPLLCLSLQVLNIERASYLEQFEAGLLDPKAFEMLEDFMATTTGKSLEAHTVAGCPCPCPLTVWHRLLLR